MKIQLAGLLASVSKAKPLVAAGALSLVALGAQANLIQNGSFEATVQAPGTFSISNSLAGGWAGLPNIELRNNLFGSAQDGSNFVELDTTFNSGITQTFNITGAGNYVLSFWYQARPGTAFNTNGLNAIVESSTGSLLLDSSIRPIANSPWQQFSQSFTATTAGAYTLSIFAIGRSDSLGTAVDSVSVVPEPGTYALMLAGLGVVGWMARRRKQVGGLRAEPMPA